MPRGFRGQVAAEPETGLITDCEMTMAAGPGSADAENGVKMAARDRFTGTAGDTAAMILGGLEGAMLVTRLDGDVVRFSATADRLLATITATPDDLPVQKGPQTSTKKTATAKAR